MEGLFILLSIAILLMSISWLIKKDMMLKEGYGGHGSLPIYNDNWAYY